MFIENVKKTRRFVQGNVEFTFGPGLVLAEVSACERCRADTTRAVFHMCVTAEGSHP